MTSPFDLTGKVVAVMGGTRGIGAATVLAFARAGARVALASRRAESCAAMADVLAADGHDALAMPAHIGKPGDCHDFIDATLQRFGQLDAVVANAGVNPVFAPLETLEPALWDKTLDTNLAGPWHLARAALPAIARTGGGAMVMVGSINAKLGMPGAAAYGISKAALEALVRQLATEWGARGVRINAVAPGTTRTDMIRALTEREGYESAVIARTPMARIGEPEDVAAAIVFLASPGARHITGQTLIVDGGETIARL